MAPPFTILTDFRRPGRKTREEKGERKRERQEKQPSKSIKNAKQTWCGFERLAVRVVGIGRWTSHTGSLHHDSIERCPSFLWIDAHRSSRPLSDDSICAALNPLHFTEIYTTVKMALRKTDEWHTREQVFFGNCWSKRQGHKFCFAFSEAADANTAKNTPS